LVSIPSARQSAHRRSDDGNSCGYALENARESNDWIQRALWPIRDKERGRYFILERISARGAFSPYYQRYLEREDELLTT
jgi:hypothetical protein